MGNKFYGVKKGRETGVFTSIEACRAQVNGFSGALYKKFSTKAAAEEFVHAGANTKKTNSNSKIKSRSTVIAYIDGAYNSEQSEISYGAVVMHEGEEYQFAETFDEEEYVVMRLEAGEVLGAQKMMAFAVEKGATHLTIHHYFDGIVKFCTGESNPQQVATKAYKQYFDEIKSTITVTFVQAQRGTANKTMTLAGKLAADALLESKLKNRVREESFDLTQADGFKLAGYLSDLPNVKKQTTILRSPERVRYHFSFSLEDYVNVTVYDTGKLIINGFPKEVYTAAKDYVLNEIMNKNAKKKSEEVQQNLSVYEERGKLLKTIQTAGTSKWNDFILESFKKQGNFTRCVFKANSKQATLDFHYGQRVGSVTMIPVSKNIELSTSLSKTIFKQSEFKDDGISKSHSLPLAKKTVKELIVFLSGLKGIKKASAIVGSPAREQFTFDSARGDRLYVNVFENERVILQGKPAYLFSEAMSFLSNYSEVTMEDVVEANNTFFEVDINVSDTRKELQGLMPNAYGNIDDTIIKLLSPAISLKRVNIELEDFSSFAFPVLLALEGYLKFLFSEEGIKVEQHFGEVFGWSVVDDKHELKPYIRKQLKQSNREKVLVEVYEYYRSQRHSVFHTVQDLEESRIIETKEEADVIVNDVIALIERTYVKFIAK